MSTAKQASKPLTKKPEKHESPRVVPDSHPWSRRLAILIGGLVGIVPVVIGLLPFLDPLRHRKGLVERPKMEGDDGKPGLWVKVTTLDAVHERPTRFQLIADRQDAWNLFRNEPVGAVYLFKTSTDAIPTAMSVTCPHLGCSVSYAADACDGVGGYKCPCHESMFSLDGVCKFGPSPRPLDTLQVQVRNSNEVWVKFQKFHGGRVEKDVKA